MYNHNEKEGTGRREEALIALGRGLVLERLRPRSQTRYEMKE